MPVESDLSSPRKEELRSALEHARRRTLALLDEAPEEFLKVRVHDFYSPIGWHFGHVGRTEEFWIAKTAFGRPCLSDHLSFLFADLPENPKDARTRLPERAEIVEYLESTRVATLAALEEADFDPASPYLRDGYVWDFALQHECQHQETIAEMLQLIRQTRNQEPDPPVLEAKQSVRRTFATIPGGSFVMGSNAWTGYDNERGEHEVDVAPFQLAEAPVTAAEWVEFISEGGYARCELWSEDGWAWRERERAEKPEFWTLRDGRWLTWGAAGLREIHPDEPAMSLSWFEAEAFAHWVGARLPTEAEWEYAARAHGDPSQADCDLCGWGPRPTSGEGIRGLYGGAWEWTSSLFLPYPGFEAFPYDGYSKDHMKGAHRVCRGGSWATSRLLIRPSFRNWYVPKYRQGLLGMRLARDI